MCLCVCVLLIILITSQSQYTFELWFAHCKMWKMTKFLSEWTKNQNSQFRILNLRAFQALSGLGSTAVEFVIQFCPEMGSIAPP